MEKAGKGKNKDVSAVFSYLGVISVSGVIYTLMFCEDDSTLRS